MVSHQQWFDGICTTSGVVCWVLLYPFHSAVTWNQLVFSVHSDAPWYTMEEHITSQAKQGGIQIDIYPLLASAIKFKDENGSSKDIRMSPR